MLVHKTKGSRSILVLLYFLGFLYFFLVSIQSSAHSKLNTTILFQLIKPKIQKFQTLRELDALILREAFSKVESLKEMVKRKAS